jgi:hypothetical protein
MEDKFNPDKLDAELKAAGLPIAGCSSTGRIDYTRQITPAEAATAQAILEAHDPKPAPVITNDEKLEALWQQIAEGDAEAVERLRERLNPSG